MEKDEFIEELGIEGDQSYADDGSLVVTLTEDGWSKAQVILDNCDELEEDEESSSLDMHHSDLQYLNDYFIINLIAKFKDPEEDGSYEEYKLVIKDR